MYVLRRTVTGAIAAVVAAWLVGPAVSPAAQCWDFDGDGDVDVSDFAHFQACFNGPGVAPASGCLVDADADDDGDVDVGDFAAFQVCFNGPGRPPAHEACACGCPTTGMETLVGTFLSHPMNAGLFVSAAVTPLGTVTSMPQAILDLVDGAAFIEYPPEPFKVYRLDPVSIPDPATLDSARAAYGAYVAQYVSLGDCLVRIDWTPTSGASFHTIGVVSNAGVVRFEPLADMVLDVSSEPGTGPVPLAGPPTGVNVQEWKNLLGIVKARANLEVQVLGADGCQGTGVANFTSGAAFPFVVQPPNAQPATVLTCFQKPRCMCRANPPESQKMECYQAQQAYSVIARIGTQWFGADLVTYSGTAKAWACADGQGGAGNF